MKNSYGGDREPCGSKPSKPRAEEIWPWLQSIWIYNGKWKTQYVKCSEILPQHGVFFFSSHYDIYLFFKIVFEVVLLVETLNPCFNMFGVPLWLSYPTLMQLEKIVQMIYALSIMCSFIANISSCVLAHQSCPRTTLCSLSSQSSWTCCGSCCTESRERVLITSWPGSLSVKPSSTWSTDTLAR